MVTVCVCIRLISFACVRMCSVTYGLGLSRISGIARAFLDGRVAHLEGYNEEENERSLRKNTKKYEESGTLAHPEL